MIEFVFGRESSSKTEYVIEGMKKALREGHRCILLIPEQQALFWDTVVAKRFDPTDAFNIEAVSFKRLANSVFRTYGGVAKNYVTEAQKTLFMWCAVKSVSEKLLAFGSAQREDRYVPLMLRAANEMKLYGISAEQLMEASEKTRGEKGSLSPRLHDLSLIYAAYDALIHTAHDDPEEIPDALCATLEEHDFFADTCVFVDSFYTLTPKEMKVMDHVIAGAQSVLITFAMEAGDQKKPHMEYVSDYMKKMVRLCQRRGKDIKKTSIPDGRGAEFAYLSAHLWDYGAPPLENGGENVSIVSCADRYDEASLVAARIKDLCSKGAHFGDIACVSANFEALRGITDIELERQGIPVYVSGKTPVTGQPALRLILKAAAVCAGGWKKEDIIACARTGLCGLTADEADALEMYTDKWRIRSKARYCCDGWDMNADGYCAEESRWGKTILALANSAREKLVPPLEAFSEAFPGTVRDACAAAYKLLCDLSVYDSLLRETAALEAAGKLADAQKKSRVWGAVMQVLDTMAESIPDTPVDARRFASLLKRTADTCHIGSIPDGVDRVVLGSVGSVRLDGIKHLIVLGAVSGEFPRVPADGGFFCDADREKLFSLGIELAPNSVKSQREEMFRFSETVSSPSETLTLTVPSDSSGNHPSLGTLRIEKLLPSCKKYDFTSPEGERIIRNKKATEDERALSPLSADRDRTTGAALTRLFDKDINLTQTKIECFNACAFKYYCRHILNLSEGNAAELNPADVGTFVHSILENFLKESSGDVFPLESDTVLQRADSLIGEYKKAVLPAGEAGYVDYLFSRISKSIRLFAKALNEEFAQSRFSPYRFELRVGFSDDLPAVPIRLSNGRYLTVRGIVDRVDVMREDDKVYLRVVDYKTGNKSFSLKKVMQGENIQLLLYLFALCNMPRDCSFAKELLKNGERPVPAGAVYFSAKPGDIFASELLSENESENYALGAISRTGIVLGTDSIVRAMDRDISGRYAPVRLSKKGELKGSFVESEEDFTQIKNALDAVLRDVGNRIISGEAGACPSGYGDNSACKWCAMKPLCRHSGREAQITEGGEADE